MANTNPEFLKYENALNSVNKKLELRLDELDKLCRGRMKSSVVAWPLATAPYLSELGWIHYVNRALDSLDEVNKHLDRLRINAARQLSSRLFEQGFPTESMDVES